MIRQADRIGHDVDRIEAIRLCAEDLGGSLRLCARFSDHLNGPQERDTAVKGSFLMLGAACGALCENLARLPDTLYAGQNTTGNRHKWPNGGEKGC